MAIADKLNSSRDFPYLAISICVVFALFLIIDFGHTGYQTFGTEGFVLLDKETSINDAYDIRFRGVNNNDGSGFSVATGDINNDNELDLLIGSYDSPDHVGKVDIVFGPITNGNYDLSNPDITISGLTDGVSLGYSVDSGDINNDGIDDLLIGVGEVGTKAVPAGTGKVIIFLGPLSSGTLQQANSDIEINGTTLNGRFGSDVNVGDFNNDTFNDLVIGEYGFNNIGRLNVIYGPIAIGSYSSSDIINLTYNGSNLGSLGAEIDVADINNDGFVDIISSSAVEINPPNRGQAYLLFGPFPNGQLGFNISQVANVTINVSNEDLSNSVAIGDINRDGMEDILLGNRDTEIFVLYGPFNNGDSFLINATYSNFTFTDRMIDDIDVVDFDGNGKDDIILGDNSISSDKGDTYILYATEPQNLKCGDYVNENLLLTTHLRNETNGTVCPGLGLIVNASGITIDCNDFRITGKNNNASGILIEGFTNVEVKNCEIYNFSKGIGIYGVNDSFFDSNILLNNNFSMMINKSHRNEIKNSIAYSSTPAHFGFFLSNSTYNNFTSNQAFQLFVGYAVFFSDYNIFNKNNISNSITGIGLAGSNYNHLSNNNLLSGQTGIAVGQLSLHNTLISNVANDNSEEGIRIRSESNYTLITSNTVNDNNEGIVLSEAHYCNIISNYGTGNTEHGIDIDSSNNNKMVNNTMQDVAGVACFGISGDSHSNLFENNIARNSNVAGFLLQGDADNNALLNNTAFSCSGGISINTDFNDISSNVVYFSNTPFFGIRATGNNNTIYDNIVFQNDVGIWLFTGTLDNLIYNNYIFDNIVDALESGILNFWNTTNQTGPNIIGGPRIGGNYYSNFDAVCVDGGNGFCDIPYAFPTGGIDFLPLALTDSDGDGFPPGIDCDDTDPARRPVFPEQDTYVDSNLELCPSPFGGYTNVNLIVNETNVTVDCDDQTLTLSTIFTNQTNTIIENCVLDNGSITIQDTHTGVIIQNNVIIGCLGAGINHMNAEGDFILNNIVTGCTMYGLLMFNVNNTLVQGNNFSNNLFAGTYLFSGTNNNFTLNNMDNNLGFGLYLDFLPFNNLIYDNIFSNNGVFDAADASGGLNFWNTTKQLATNIVGGKNIGGNYYSRYTGIDTDNDDIGNTPFIIPGLGPNSTDFLPLVLPAGTARRTSGGGSGGGDSGRRRIGKCGDATCQPHESYYICPGDCPKAEPPKPAEKPKPVTKPKPKEEPITQPVIEPPVEPVKETPKPEKQEPQNKLLFPLLVLLILQLGVGIYIAWDMKF